MTSPLYRAINSCRACGSERLAEVLDLGLFALSDFRGTPDAFEDRAPLVVVRCEDCTLVQLRHTVDRDRLYRRYWYRSGTQPAMVSALRDVVDDARGRVPLQPGDTVLDIGANDGTLLAQYPDDLVKVAYEPATNLWPELAHHARIAGGFFPQQTGTGPITLREKAKIITSIACFYDVDDPGAFVDGIKANLADDGVWINQLAYLPDTLAANNVGDFCHEHLTYWSAEPLDRLLHARGMGLSAMTRNDVNGGSARFYATHRQTRFRPWAKAYDIGDFVDRIERTRWNLRKLLHEIRRQGKTVWGYAAATKFNTCLQYWGVGPDLVGEIADRNPQKWGLFTPTGQIVTSEEVMRASRPDYLLVGAYHFLPQFLERERDLLAQGTKFIVPFPELHVVGGEALADLPTQVVAATDGAAVRR